MIAIRLDVLLQLRRHWRAIDVLLQNEIERQQAEEEREKAQGPNIDQTIEYLKRRYANSK